MSTVVTSQGLFSCRLSLAAFTYQSDIFLPCQAAVFCGKIVKCTVVGKAEKSHYNVEFITILRQQQIILYQVFRSFFQYIIETFSSEFSPYGQ